MTTIRCLRNVLAILLLSVPVTVWAGELVLVDNGKPAATIVYPARSVRSENPLDSRKAEALRLKDYINKISGANLPVVADDKPVDGTVIHIGPTKHLKKLGVDLDSLSGDSFIMRVIGSNLVLAGVDKYRVVDKSALTGKKKKDPMLDQTAHNNKRGTFYAVNTFLEDVCGVRWFMPGPMGEDILKMLSIKVPDDLDRTEAASIDFRIMRRSEQWRQNNKVNNSRVLSNWGGHTWRLLVPPKKYFKDHPEYFAMINGKRTVGTEGDPLLCTANPDVLRISIQSVRDAFDGGCDMFQLGQPDNYGGKIDKYGKGGPACQCEECMAIGDQSQAGLGRRVYKFHCDIAREVKKSHPDKILQFLIYGPSRIIPDDFEGFDDNIIIDLCDPNEERLTRWTKHGVKSTVYVYNWTTYYGMGYGPKSSIKQIIDEMDRYRRYNVQGIFWCGGSNNWGLEGVQYWLAAKMQWNLNADPYKLLDDYFSRFYRNSEKPMRAFFDLLDDRQNNHSPETLKDPSLMYLSRFPQEVLNKMDVFLAEAKKLAADDEVVQKRIEFTEDSFQHVKLCVDAFEAGKKYDRTKNLKDLIALRDAVNTRRGYIDSVIEAQDNGQYDHLTHLFGDARLDTRTELLTGQRSYFRKFKPWNWNFDEMIKEARENVI